MKGSFYKALGFLTWQGILFELRRRSGKRSVRFGGAGLLAVGIAAGIVLAQRRSGPSA
jgi:hypothetical protein